MVTEMKRPPKKRGPSTPRTQSLKQAHVTHEPVICSERSVLVTRSCGETEALPPVLRQAMAFDKVLSGGVVKPTGAGATWHPSPTL